MSDFDDAVEESQSRWQSSSARLKDERWEETVIKYLLKFSRQETQGDSMRFKSYERTGVSRLTFFKFHESFPSFPLWLHCHKIDYVFETSIEQLTLKPGKSKIYTNYCELCDRTPDFWGDRPVGMVFEWLHSGGQLKIFHNYDFKAKPISAGLRMEVPVKLRNGTTVSFWLENLKHFLINIEWAEEEKDE